MNRTFLRGEVRRGGGHYDAEGQAPRGSLAQDAKGPSVVQGSDDESAAPRRRSPAVVSAYIGTAATVVAAVTGLMVAFHGSSASPSDVTLRPFNTTTSVPSATTTSSTPTTTSTPGPPVSITGFGTGDPILVQGTYTSIPTGYQIYVFATSTSTAASASPAQAQPWVVFGPATAMGGQWTEKIPRSSAPPGAAVYRATLFASQAICPSTQTSGTGPPLACTGDPVAPLEQDGPNAKGTAGVSMPVTYVNA
jgi:hypothetical protein